MAIEVGSYRIRRSPAVLAVQWDGKQETASDIIDWILNNGGIARWHDEGPGLGLPHISIDIDTGSVKAFAHYWIIFVPDDDGNFSVCQPSVFGVSYELS